MTPNSDNPPASFQVTMRCYEELNDFLPRDLQKKSFAVTCDQPRSVKDLIESQGVPHTEIDLILVDGESVGFDRVIGKATRVSVYPKFESLDIRKAAKLNRPPLREIRFIADIHLGKLARRLRLLGFDCVYEPPWEDTVLAQRSADEKRVMLTRDRGLLKRSIVTHGIYLHSDSADEQVKEVVRRLDLAELARPLARCAHCNGILKKVPKETARGNVPSRTFHYVHDYLRCKKCGRFYWKGTHWKKIRRIVDQSLA